MQPGDLILVRGHSYLWYDDAIKLGEILLDGHGRYTHVAIYLGGDTVAEAQGGRLSGPAPLKAYEGDYDWGALDLTDEQRQAVVKRAQELYGRPYNWLEIGEIGVEAVSHIALPHKDNEREFICCEYARDVIRDATGLVLSDKRLCVPDDFADSSLVHIHKL